MMSPMRTVRPPKEITKANASIVHKAQAWNAVEDAQRVVNARAEQAKLLTFTAYDAALTAWQTCTAPPGSVESGLRWAHVREAQKKLNKSARAVGLDGIDTLDAALEYYAYIGGDPKRAPGVGGLS